MKRHCFLFPQICCPMTTCQMKTNTKGICSVIVCHHPDTMIIGHKVPFLSYGSFRTEKKIYGNIKLFESKIMLHQEIACSYYTLAINFKK